MTSAGLAPTWVVGSGGLLGSAVLARRRREGATVLTPRVTWRTASAHAELTRGAKDLLAAAAGGPWALLWCAGAGVTGASQDLLAEELACLRLVLDLLTPAGAAGTVLLASSAGGLYAGCGAGPHTELTPPRPISAYGEAKLAAEEAVSEWAAATGGRAVAVRYANLYGPGQNLAKPQGLISHLCRGFLTAQPVSIYVPVDTLRDYIYVDDAADLSVRLLHEDLSPGHMLIKICASGESVSIGGLIGACRTAFRRRPRVVMGSSPLAAEQSLDLRLRSVVLPELVPQPHTTLVAGIASTLSGTRKALLGSG